MNERADNERADNQVISRNIYPKLEPSTPPNIPLARGGAVGSGVMLVFSYLEIT